MGSIYALACASRLPLRVAKMALAGALVPLDTPGARDGMSPMVSGLYDLAQTNPDELSAIFATLAQSPPVLLAAMSASACESDRKVLHERAAEFEIEYARIGGIEGVTSDFVLASKNWGFPLHDINTKTHLWCGTADCNTPPGMTTCLASLLSNSRCYMLPDEGHFSIYGHWEEILESLA